MAPRHNGEWVMSITNSEQSSVKRIMNVALIGVHPADQITLKGYLRVLLRLDVGLEWTSANAANVDLFMISHEFRNSSSVVKLLSTHQNASVLYVRRNELGEGGGLSGDLLTLPLKHIASLHDWLNRNVAILNGSIAGTGQSKSHDALKETHAAAAKTQPITPGSLITSVDYQGIIELIKRLSTKHNELYEIIGDNRQVLAVIDANRRLVWVRQNEAISHKWRLQVHLGNPPDSKGELNAIDANQWLWQQSWASNDDALLALIDDNIGYHLRYWIKPEQGAQRGTILRILASMEVRTGTPRDIAERSNVDLQTAKKTIFALLASGSLQPTSYHNLKAVQTESASAANINQTYPTSNHAASNTQLEQNPMPNNRQEESVEKNEKLGFLARLRRKLGI